MLGIIHAWVDVTTIPPPHNYASVQGYLCKSLLFVVVAGSKNLTPAVVTHWPFSSSVCVKL